MQNAQMIFGLHPVKEAIESGKTIDKIFIQNTAKSEAMSKLQGLARKHSILVQYVPIERINRFTNKNHQGVVAMLSPVDFHKIETLLPTIFEAGKTPLLLILDRVSDVRNFGAIVRTAECAGADAVIVPEKGSAAINADSIKTSAGAIYNLPVCKESFLPKALEYLQLSGIQLVAATEKSEETLYDVDFTQPTAIVMGSEEDGVSSKILQVADAKAAIPLKGQTKSLNVSVACGAFLFEAVRQRMGN